jgi:metal-responsive CopG/Arc/MetJ family transcriptional regulator
MQKILISIPDSIVARLRAVIPDRQRSKFISKVVEKELEKREKALYQCALEVEKDETLNREMKEWDSTIGDGIEHESW